MLLGGGGEGTVKLSAGGYNTEDVLQTQTHRSQLQLGFNNYQALKVMNS